MQKAKVIYQCGCEAESYNGVASAVCLSHPNMPIRDVVESNVLFECKDYRVSVDAEGDPKMEMALESPHAAYMEWVMSAHSLNRLDVLLKQEHITTQEYNNLSRGLHALRKDALRRLVQPK